MTIHHVLHHSDDVLQSLCHHIIYSDVLTYFANKIEESEIFHPVVIVHQFGTVRYIRLEVEELGKLILIHA